MNVQSQVARPREHTVPELLPPRTVETGSHRRLLEAALTLFADRGYHGVSVRNITKSVGIQPSAIYAHVASKEDLLVQLMRLGHEEVRESLRRATLRAGPTARDQLAEFVRTYVRFHATYPLLGTVTHHELHALPQQALQEVLALRRDGVELLKAVLDHGIATGEFHCSEPWFVIATIAAMGIRVSSWYRPPGHAASTAEDEYGTRVQDWFLPKQFSPEEVEDGYVELALKLVR